MPGPSPGMTLRVSVILRCERQRASKDERPRRPGRRPSWRAFGAHLRVTEENSALYFTRLRHRQLVRLAPALHPGLDLVPRHAHPGTLELGEAALVFLECLWRPRVFNAH